MLIFNSGARTGKATVFYVAAPVATSPVPGCNLVFAVYEDWETAWDGLQMGDYRDPPADYIIVSSPQTRLSEGYSIGSFSFPLKPGRDYLVFRALNHPEDTYDGYQGNMWVMLEEAGDV